jgi:decaprenylphospho-beta-D-erythro-pentofuranosid-2-ulose 2-reductase
MNILVFGATSTIAQSLMKSLVAKTSALYLVGRDQEKLSSTKADLEVRGIKKIATFCSDLNLTEKHQEIFKLANEFMGSIDLLIIAHGILGKTLDDERSSDAIKLIFDTNCLSAISILTEGYPYFERQNKGTVLVISSVAGIRGRRSNYIYGASKAALTTFLSGYRGRCKCCNTNVITVLPGFVDTEMTKDLKKGALVSSPELVAKQIAKAINNSVNKDIFVPFYWQFIMFIIWMLPEKIFQKLKI